jgi:hypothetical protein
MISPSGGRLMDAVAGKVAADGAKGLFAWLKGWWTAPVLDIRVSDEKPHLRNVPIEQGPPPHAMRQAWFHHLAVINTGRSVATRCTAQLVSVQPVAPGGEVLAKPCILAWAHEGDFKSVDIHPTDPPRKLDLVFVYHKDGRLIFNVQMPEVPAGFGNMFARSEHTVMVRVTAAEGCKTEARFRLVPGERDGDITITKL